MKSIKVSLFFLAIVLSMSIASAGTPLIGIMPHSQDVSAGSTYTINITVDPNATAIQGAQADLIFDPNFVTVNSLSNVGKIFEGHGTFETVYSIDNVNGVVSSIGSAIIDGSNVTSTGLLATVTLTVDDSATGDSTLELVNTEVTAALEGGTPMLPIVSNGTLIGPRPSISITPPSDMVSAGGIFTINITVDPNATAIQGAQADLIFDPNFVTVNSLSNVGKIFEGHGTFETVYSIDNVNGVVSSIGSAIIDGSNVTSTGLLATVTLTVDDSATGNFTLNLTNTEVTADGGTALRLPDIHVNNGTFTIRLDDEDPVINSVILNRTEVTDGDPILVTVNATDNFGVTSVIVEGVSLTPAGNNIWEGIIIAATGNDVVVNVCAMDGADNAGWNNSTAYTARWIREDVYPDGWITITDIVRVGNHMGETGEPGWIPEDVYPDGTTTITDIVRVGNHMGETRLY